MEIYANAPISEAALDIRVRVSGQLTDEVLATARDDRYPELFQRPGMMQIRLETNPKTHQASATPVSATSGYAYRTEDKLNIFQVRSDGFTHNRLAPYEEWERFVAEAKRLWTIYRSAIQPEAVELIGLNYVNQIDIPFGVDINEYLKTYIEVPRGIPNQINVFAMSYQVTIPDDAGLLHIGQQYGQPRLQGHATVILNIQAFKQVDFLLNNSGEDDLWRAFDVLRKAKSDAFEACITDKTRENIR